MALSKRQQQVVDDLNNGYILVTDSQMAGALVCNSANDKYYIGTRVFWNLVEAGAIHQQMRMPFDYVLTKEFKK